MIQTIDFTKRKYNFQFQEKYDFIPLDAIDTPNQLFSTATKDGAKSDLLHRCPQELIGSPSLGSYVFILDLKMATHHLIIKIQAKD